MSAQTIARWNAIPLERPEPDQSVTSLKRSRSQDNDNGDDDDDVSLVSRSPSPPPPDAMDVDKYDEYYLHKPDREVVTVETKINSSNVGFSMLAKMGWVEGSPLGLSGDGRVEPIPFYVKNDLTGLGKANQDVRMIEATVSQRRELDSERQTKETEEQRRQREDAVARREAVKSEISTVLRPFYCDVCDKQFQNVAQYDEHTNSYAHHHKVRFRDMQLAQRASRNTEQVVNERKEKERKREEKELRKIAKAAGIKMSKPSVPAVAIPSTTAPTGAGDNQAPGFKKSGWATVLTSTNTDVSMTASQAIVGDVQSSTTAQGGSWAPVSAPPPPPPSSLLPAPLSQLSPPRTDYSSAPAFQTGGWMSLESTSGPPPPLPAYRAPSGPTPPASKEPHAGSASTSHQPVTAPPSISPVIPRPPAPADRQKPSRSGWQTFQAGAPGRRRH